MRTRVPETLEKTTTASTSICGTDNIEIIPASTIVSDHFPPHSQKKKVWNNFANSAKKLDSVDATQYQRVMDSDDQTAAWVPWFCSIPGHEFFAEVDEEYIRDSFNLYGLRNQVRFYDAAWEMILMSEAPDEDDLQDADFLDIYRDATDLYGLIHARYIISPRGLQVMRDSFTRAVFGTCPRVLCNRQTLLPIGTNDELRVSRVKTFCPRCCQLYVTKQRYSDIDGAYFGTSFPHIFLQHFPNLVPDVKPESFIPRIFGFKVRMKNPSVLTLLNGSTSYRKLELGNRGAEQSSQEGATTAEQPTADTANTEDPAVGNNSPSNRQNSQPTIDQMRSIGSNMS